MFFYYITGNELYHHGIKGQRWGIRRFQNEDGTLTAEGRARYGVSGDERSKKELRDLNTAARKAQSNYDAKTLDKIKSTAEKRGYKVYQKEYADQSKRWGVETSKNLLRFAGNTFIGAPLLGAAIGAGSGLVAGLLAGPVGLVGLAAGVAATGGILGTGAQIGSTVVGGVNAIKRQMNINESGRAGTHTRRTMISNS